MAFMVTRQRRRCVDCQALICTSETADRLGFGRWRCLRCSSPARRYTAEQVKAASATYSALFQED